MCIADCGVSCSGQGKGDACAQAIAEVCPTTKSLRFVCSTLTDAGLRTIAAGMRRLESLDVICGPGHITDAGLVALAHGCKALRKIWVRNLQAHTNWLNWQERWADDDDRNRCYILNLDIQTTITDETLFALAEHCPRLDTVSFRGFPMQTAAGRGAVDAVVAKNREYVTWRGPFGCTVVQHTGGLVGLVWFSTRTPHGSYAREHVCVW